MTSPIHPSPLKPRRPRRTTEPRPIYFTDEHGIPCVRMPLAGTDLTAILWQIDYERLKRAGLSNYWTANRSGAGNIYVRAKRSGMGLLMVARMVLEGPEGELSQVVRYANGDRLDLRRPNLYVTVNPYASARARDKLIEAPKRSD